MKTPGIRYVVVVHGKLEGECKYPVNGGSAYMTVYDKDYGLAFEDGDGNRFYYDIEYEKKDISYSEDIFACHTPRRSRTCDRSYGSAPLSVRAWADIYSCG